MNVKTTTTTTTICLQLFKFQLFRFKIDDRFVVLHEKTIGTNSFQNCLCLSFPKLRLLARPLGRSSYYLEGYSRNGVREALLSLSPPSRFPRKQTLSGGRNAVGGAPHLTLSSRETHFTQTCWQSYFEFRSPETALLVLSRKWKTSPKPCTPLPKHQPKYMYTAQPISFLPRVLRHLVLRRRSRRAPKSISLLLWVSRVEVLFRAT